MCGEHPEQSKSHAKRPYVKPVVTVVDLESTGAVLQTSCNGGISLGNFIGNGCAFGYRCQDVTSG